MLTPSSQDASGPVERRVRCCLLFSHEVQSLHDPQIHLQFHQDAYQNNRDLDLRYEVGQNIKIRAFNLC